MRFDSKLRPLSINTFFAVLAILYKSSPFLLETSYKSTRFCTKGLLELFISQIIFVYSSKKYSYTLYNSASLLYNSTKSAGYHELTFDATNLASGIYFFRISATSTREIEAFVDTKKLMLMKWFDRSLSYIAVMSSDCILLPAKIFTAKTRIKRRFH